MRALIDSFVTAIQEPVAEIGTRWPLERYQPPLVRSTEKLPACSIYPLAQEADPTTSNFDILRAELGLEVWTNAARESETLKRDTLEGAAWIDIHDRIVTAIYGIFTIAEAFEVRYMRTTWGLDLDTQVRLFRVETTLWRPSDYFH